MIEPAADDPGGTAAKPIGTAVEMRSRLVIAILDDTGGGIVLALADDDARVMAHAIDLLIAEQLAQGAMVKVTTRERAFALSRIVDEAGVAAIRLSDVYNPRACVRLSIDVAVMIATLLAASGRLRAQMAFEWPRRGISKPIP